MEGIFMPIAFTTQDLFIKKILEIFPGAIVLSEKEAARIRNKITFLLPASAGREAERAHEVQLNLFDNADRGGE
jgi:hypothetical protein